MPTGHTHQKIRVRGLKQRYPLTVPVHQSCVHGPSSACNILHYVVGRINQLSSHRAVQHAAPCSPLTLKYMCTTTDVQVCWGRLMCSTWTTNPQ